MGDFLPMIQSLALGWSRGRGLRDNRRMSGRHRFRSNMMRGRGLRGRGCRSLCGMRRMRMVLRVVFLGIRGMLLGMRGVRGGVLGMRPGVFAAVMFLW